MSRYVDKHGLEQGLNDPPALPIALVLLVVDLAVVIGYAFAWVVGGLLRLLLAGCNAISGARGLPLPQQPVEAVAPITATATVYRTRRPQRRTTRRVVRRATVPPVPAATAAPTAADTERETLIEAFMRQHKFPRAAAEQMADAHLAQRS